MSRIMLCGNMLLFTWPCVCVFVCCGRCTTPCAVMAFYTVVNLLSIKMAKCTEHTLTTRRTHVPIRLHLLSVCCARFVSDWRTNEHGVSSIQMDGGIQRVQFKRIHSCRISHLTQDCLVNWMGSRFICSLYDWGNLLLTREPAIEVRIESSYCAYR